jgi:hypothetical protein
MTARLLAAVWHTGRRCHLPALCRLADRLA